MHWLTRTVPATKTPVEERPSHAEVREFSPYVRRLFMRSADMGMVGYALLFSLVIHVGGVTWLAMDTLLSDDAVVLSDTPREEVKITTTFFIKKPTIRMVVVPPKALVEKTLAHAPEPEKVEPKPKTRPRIARTKTKRRRFRRKTKRVMSKVAVISAKAPDLVSTARVEPQSVIEPKPVAVAVNDEKPTKNPVTTERDVPDLEGMMAKYTRQVSRVFKRRYYYPRRADRAGITGRVVIELTLDATGRVIKRRVLMSSGHTILDQAALKSVAAVVQLPMPPAALKWRQRAIQIPFVYRPRPTEG
jgi:protein TonB